MCFVGAQNKPLLNLACRHHIHELVIAKVFETVIERASSCPQIKLLHRFSTAWNTINAQVFESAISDDQLVTELDPIKKDILDFLKKQLRTFQPRDDYKELFQFCILFLSRTSDDVTVGGVHAPGAYHRARWMAKPNILFEDILVPIPILSYTSRTFMTSTVQCFRDQSLLLARIWNCYSNLSSTKHPIKQSPMQL